MIVVRVELHSAITRTVTELARMVIINDATGDNNRRNYIGRAFRGRSRDQLDKGTVQKEARITDWHSNQFHVWNLVSMMLIKLGYIQGR